MKDAMLNKISPNSLELILKSISPDFLKLMDGFYKNVNDYLDEDFVDQINKGEDGQILQSYAEIVVTTIFYNISNKRHIKEQWLMKQSKDIKQTKASNPDVWFQNGNKNMFIEITHIKPTEQMIKRGKEENLSKRLMGCLEDTYCKVTGAISAKHEQHINNKEMEGGAFIIAVSLWECFKYIYHEPETNEKVDFIRPLASWLQDKPEELYNTVITLDGEFIKISPRHTPSIKTGIKKENGTIIPTNIFCEKDCHGNYKYDNLSGILLGIDYMAKAKASDVLSEKHWTFVPNPRVSHPKSAPSEIIKFFE